VPDKNVLLKLLDLMVPVFFFFLVILSELTVKNV